MTADPTAPNEPGSAGTQATGARSRGQHLRRRRIVQAAAALASRGGVDAMQMRTVAERAGVALGTLYRYFPSKMDLVVAVTTDEIDLLEASVKRRPPRAAAPARRAVDVLMRATRGLMREPELADALVRSLIMSNVRTDFGDRITDLLFGVATGNSRAPGDRDLQRSLCNAVTNVWVAELLEILKGRRTIEQVQRSLELAADRLLHDF